METIELIGGGIPSFVLAGDYEYHADEDEHDAGPEENAHDSTRYQPATSYKATPQCVTHCISHEHPNIVCRNRLRRPATSSATSS